MQHTVQIDPVSAPITVWLMDAVLARSTRALQVTEIVGDKELTPVIYVPIEDLNSELLRENSDTTYCPIKGTAHYWDVKLHQQTWPNMVWYYPEPSAAVAGIHGYAGFFPDRVNIEWDD